jgi:hypothetical protein
MLCALVAGWRLNSRNESRQWGSAAHRLNQKCTEIGLCLYIRFFVRNPISGWMNDLAIWLDSRNYPVMRTFRPDFEMCDPAQAIGNDGFHRTFADIKSVASESLNGIDARGPSRWQIA